MTGADDGMRECSGGWAKHVNFAGQQLYSLHRSRKVAVSDVQIGSNRTFSPGVIEYAVRYRTVHQAGG